MKHYYSFVFIIVAEINLEILTLDRHFTLKSNLQLKKEFVFKNVLRKYIINYEVMVLQITKLSGNHSASMHYAKDQI